MFISAHDRKWDVVGFNRKGTSLQIVSRLHNTLNIYDYDQQRNN
jgi:hypothetical protein